jgi:hypothetical protein
LNTFWERGVVGQHEADASEQMPLGPLGWPCSVLDERLDYLLVVYCGIPRKYIFKASLVYHPFNCHEMCAVKLIVKVCSINDVDQDR